MSNFVRFGTYNIVPRPFKDKELHEWVNRREAVITTIINNCDVIGIQEYDTETPFQMSQYIQTQLIETHKWAAYLPAEDPALPFDDVFHNRLPIFWNPKLFTLEDKTQFQLSNWNQQEAHLTPIVENRYCSYIQLTHNDTKQKLHVYNLHQQHHTITASLVEKTMAYRKQTDGLNHLLKHIQTLPSNSKIIILGDFNNPTIPSWFLNQTKLVESFTLTPPTERHNLQFNSYHNWEVPALQQNQHIDHILVSPHLTITSTSIILNSQGSDHYLLQSTVSL